jgi:ankyrin repeat protein
MKKIMAITLITLLLGAQSAFGMDALAFRDAPQPLYLQLIKACESGNQATVERLLNLGADPNARDEHGRTPIVVAFQSGISDLQGRWAHQGIVKALLAAKADANLTSRETGNSPLMLAANFRDRATVEALLLRANVHATNKKGKTALDFAVDDEVRALLQAAMQPK